MNMMKVEIVSTQTTIVPSSPTPDHLKRFTLSIFDQLAPPAYIPAILFYGNTGDISVQEASDRLKKSLSLTLTFFFPFASRSNIKDNTCFDCTDEGVQHTEARVNYNLRDFLAPPDMDALGRLLPIPCGFSVEAEGSGGFMLIQQSVFECGGIALGICCSHKIADAATFSCFLKSWVAACACGGDVTAAAPEFNLASLFPPLDSFARSSYPTDPAYTADKCTFTRFVFSPSKVSALKAKSCSASVSNPTRIEAVSSLIWQCAMRASSIQLNIESSKSCHALRQNMNLRKRVNPPLPDSSFGNFVGIYVSKADNDDRTNNVASLAAKMRDAKEKYMQGYPTKLRGPEGLSLIRASAEGEAVGLGMTSWSKFGLYEADFGWGKPIWTSICKMKQDVKNVVILLDARDGEGIEAYVSLPEDVMLMFEQDPEFLSFASLNPNVIATD